MKELLPRTKKTSSRIVSVVPSQTELLFDLGLNEEVVGITKFCIHPHVWFKTKQRVGGTKTLNLDKIRELNPDLILANKEENTQEQIEALQQEFNVYLSEISTISEAQDMILDIGQLVDREEKANQLVDQIKILQDNQVAFSTILSAVYLIWQHPYMVAGVDTFIHDMMKNAGFQNVIHDTRYPIIEIEAIQRLEPDVVLLSSEPFPFKQKHVDELQYLLPHSKVICVDGELFSWYGSRMLKAFDYFRSLHESLS